MEPVGSALPEAPAPVPNGRVLDEGAPTLPLDAAPMGGDSKWVESELVQQERVGTGSVIFGVAAQAPSAAFVDERHLPGASPV